MIPLERENYTEFHQRISSWIEINGKATFIKKKKYRLLDDIPKEHSEETAQIFNTFISRELGPNWIVGKRAIALYMEHVKLKPAYKVTEVKGKPVLRKHGKFKKYLSSPDLYIMRPKGFTKFQIRDAHTNRVVAWADKPYNLVVEVDRAELDLSG